MTRLLSAGATLRRLAAFAAAGVTLASSLVLFGVASPAGASGKTFVVGVDAPLTGGTAATGAQIKDAVTLAFHNVGDRVGSYQIKLVSINDGDSPASGASALEAAIARQGIQAVTGIWDSDVGLADMAIVARSKIPLIFNGAASAAIVSDVRKNPKKEEYWDGDVYPPSTTTGSVLVAAVNHYYHADPSAFPCGKTAALLSEQSSFGYSVVGGAVKALKADGWKVLAKEFFPIDQANNSAAIQGIERKCVSVIIGNGTATQATTGIVNEAKQTGFKGLVVVNGLDYSSTWSSLTGKNSNGVLDTGTAFLNTPVANKFQRQFKKQFGVAPTAISAGAFYDYTNYFIKVLKATLEQYHSLTSQTVWETMYKTVRTGKLVASPGVTFRGLRYSPKSWPAPVFAPNSYYEQVLQDENGKTHIVWPLSETTGKFVPPSK